MTTLALPPCARTSVGECITNSTDPTHCYRCGKVVDHARSRLAAAIATHDSQLVARVQARLDREAVERAVVLLHRVRTAARRPWWRP